MFLVFAPGIDHVVKQLPVSCTSRFFFRLRTLLIVGDFVLHDRPDSEPFFNSIFSETPVIALKQHFISDKIRNLLNARVPIIVHHYMSIWRVVCDVLCFSLYDAARRSVTDAIMTHAYHEKSINKIICSALNPSDCISLDLHRAIIDVNDCWFIYRNDIRI